MSALLIFNNMTVSVEEKIILKDFSLEVNLGEVHALMGRNGSGKTTIANVLMGHPAYKLESGTILFEGKDISHFSPDERAKLGIFIAFQYPIAVPGVTVASFLRESLKAIKGAEYVKKGFRTRVKQQLKELGIDESFMVRYINDGFSGGEKKRLEVLQLILLEPKLIVLDEIDSGLDIDTLKILMKAISLLKTKERSFLLITHYQRVIEFFTPDHVHILQHGKVVESGDHTLAATLDQKGYEAFYKDQDTTGGSHV
jgi:Fe-S cluster assembly ATP-binding protein